MSSHLLTVGQAAEALALHPKTVQRHIREGKLRATRIGKSYRIAQADLDAFAGLEHRAAPMRATCTVDIPGISANAVQRTTAFLSAAGMAGSSTRAALHLSAAYDPDLGSLKVVAIGEPGDVARVLEFIHAHVGPIA